MSNFKNSVKRNRTLALEARTLFDGSAIFDAALTLDADDGAEIAVYDAVVKTPVFEQAAKAAVTTVETSLLSANREDIFSQFNGGLSQQSSEWNAAVDRLQSDMAQGKVAVGIAFLSDSQMNGQNGSFSAEGQDGNPAIFLNRDWIEAGASVSDIESVIGDQLNEFIDSRLTADSSKEVYFIDASLSDVQTLIDAVPVDADVYLVQAGVDGYAFMAETLAGQSGITAIHVLGHGAVGEAQLGSVTLSDANLDAYSAQLAAIGQALTAEGDILLYGCNVAETGEGEAFIQQIASLTQADVAASDDVTGVGGDWELEVNAGSVEADELEVGDYEGQLAGLEFADLSTWKEAGAKLDWRVQDGSRTVKQYVNGGSGFFISPETNVINRAIQGTIEVNTFSDNDVIGFVLGYKDSKNYISFGWDQQGTRNWGNPGLDGDKELAVYKNGVKTVLATASGIWADKTLYNFKILYMADQIKVEINGSTVFDVSRPSGVTFEAGSYGFWNYSQGDVNYGNIRTAPGSVQQVVPTLQDDTYGTNTNTTLNVDKFSGILANDYDANLDEFDIVVNGTTLTTDSSNTSFNTAHGRVTVYGDGRFSYVPSSGYNGSDSFTYKLRDNDGDSNTATVTISTLEPNVAPTDITASSTTISPSASADDVVANLTVTDANSGDSHDIIIVSQTTAGMFKVVDGVLKVANPAGLVTGSTYSVELRAIDLRGLSYTETLKFIVEPDTDGDGVSDANDIDDDGDGILDIKESAPNFKWASGYTLSGNTATGTIDGVNFKYTLRNAANTADVDIQSTSMLGGTIFPAEYGVPVGSTGIKSTSATFNTIVFDQTVLNPILAFGSVGNGSTSVPIKFGDDVEVLFSNSTYGGTDSSYTDGDGDGDGDYKWDDANNTVIPGYENYTIVRFNGEYDQISFTYTQAENYATFAFGADVRQDLDTDGDGVVNRLDTDSDGDGVLDNVEAQIPGQYGLTVSDGDTKSVGSDTYTYTAPTTTDVDQDGLADVYDNDTTSANKTRATESIGLDPEDANANGTADYLIDEAPSLTVGTLNSHNGSSTDVVVVAPALTIGDVENNDQISEAKVQLDNLKSGDKLSFVNSGAIRGAYDATKGILTLSGTASIAEYQSALRTVEFSTTSGDSTDRVFSFTIGSAIPFSGNGHFYEFIEAKDISWNDAKAAAEARTLYGMQGYLATITSAAENDFVAAKLAGNGWIGASDAGAEGVWKWVTGPEAGTQFSSGSNAVNGQYENWAPGEPNDYKFGGQVPEGEEYIHFWGDGVNKGTWNDFPNSVVPGFGLSIAGYIVEYGGMPGDVATTITDTATMVVNDAPVIATTDSATYTEKGSAVILAPGLTLSDIDDSNLNSATVRISNGATVGDVLGFVDTNEITHSYNSSTYTLTLTGIATKSQWQTALRSVTYEGGNSQPSSSKTISWTVSDATLTSGAATSGLTVTAVNDAPAIVVGSSNLSGALTEADGTNSGTKELNATGVITIEDVDIGDSVTLSEVYNNDIVWSGGTLTVSELTASQVTELINGFVVSAESLTIDPATGKAAGSWTYSTTVDLNFLAPTETLKFSYNVKATDAAGVDSAPQKVEITLNGAQEPMNVNNVSVLESDAYATFVINNTSARTIALDLMDRTATGGDGTDTTSGNDDYNRTFEYSLDGGSTWTTYSKAFTTSSAVNTVQVRVDITDDTFPDSGELFDLNVYEVSTTLASAKTYDVNSGTVDIRSLTLVSGNADSQSAVYRAENVFTADNGDEVDALITIVSKGSNVGDFVLDYDTTNPQLFSPRFSSTNGQDAEVTFKIAFVEGNSNSAVALTNFYVTGYDVDGTSSNREYAILEGVSSYLVEPDGQGVKASFVDNNTVSFSGTQDMGPFDPDTSYQANYDIPKTDFEITLGTTYTNQRYFYVSVGAAEVTFSDAANTVLAKDALTATATIVEPPAGLKVYDATVNEGAGTISFRVARADSEGAATVDYTVTAGTATVGANTTSDVYGALTDGVLKGTVSFADGIATQYITLNVSNDAIFEGKESFNISLSNLSDRLTLDSAADAKAIGTIVDDGSGGGADNDDRPAFTVNDVTVNESANTLTFTVSKTGDVAQGTTSSVFYSLQNKTATAGEDYTADSGWLSFANGEKAKTVTVTLTNDNVYEGAEQFYINLSQASNATIADSQGVATIRDDGTSNGSLSASDDDRPVFSVNSVTVNEDAGTAVFTVTKTGSTELSSSVDFFTSNLVGGAIAGSDYTAISSSSPATLTFAKDETTQTVTVAILDDSLFEGSESFQVNLANATAGTVSSTTGIGVGTIKDDGTGGATSGGSGTGSDDDRPVFSINDVSVNEGAGTIQFTVSLSGTTAQDATINYEVIPESAGISDYSANNPQALAGTLTFYAGQSQTQTITLNVTQDDIYEVSESFNIKLTNPTQSLLSATDDVGTGTIWDNGTSNGTTLAADDDLPSISIDDVIAFEADGTLKFTVTRDKASLVDTTFNYLVRGASAQEGDYTANDALSGKLIIPAGSAGDRVTITLNITDDTLYERVETFEVILSSAKNASILDGAATGTIYDNDEPNGAFLLNDVTVSEASKFAVFEVFPPVGGSTYNLTFSLANIDTSLTSNNLISYKLGSNAWVVGTSLANYSRDDRLLVRVDITDEQELALDTNEAFELTVQYGSDASVDIIKAKGTIVDDGSGVVFDDTTGEIDSTATLDDDRTVFTINDVSVSEGGVASFTVSRGNVSNAAVSTAQTVNFATSITGSDNAESNDFTSGSGTLTFAAGETSKTITVQTTADDIYEGDETFTVSLSNNSVGSRVDDTIGVATIQDDGTGADNDKPTLSISDPSIEEGSTLNFALTLDKATEADLEVRFALENVGTFDASDYSAMTVSYSGGTLQPNSVTGLYTIPAGVQSFTVSVVTTEDTVFEGPETVKLHAYVTDSAVTDTDVGSGTVNDNGSGPDGDDSGSVVDDDRPVFTVNDVSVTELDGTLTFTVTKTGSTNLSSTVAYSFSDSSATGGTQSDYVGTAGTLTFAAGETQKVVNVTINDDAGEPVWEGTETFTINLATATNAVIGDAKGVGSISDQEDRTVQVSGVGPINENSTYAVFEVEAIGGGFNDLTFTVFNATANLIDVAGKPDATVSYIAPAGGNKFYVGVTIANEDDNNFEGIENFGLRASFSDDTSITDAGYNLIVDDGTGVRYDYANVPNLADSLNLYELDNDLTGQDSGGRPQPTAEGEVVTEVVVQKVLIDTNDAFKEVKENLDAYGLADAIASEAQAQIDKLSGKIALYVLPAVQEARSDTVSLFRRLASDDGNAFMGSSVVRSSLAFDSLAPVSELVEPFANDVEIAPEDVFGGEVTNAERADVDALMQRLADVKVEQTTEHQEFSAQLLAAAKSNFGAGVARVSAQQLISAEPTAINLKDTNS